MRIRSIVLAAALALGSLVGLAGKAGAQSWSDSMTSGYWGGYNHFGGYYDTYGDYGGHTNYLGYVRTEGSNGRTATLITIPLQRNAHHRHAGRKIAHKAAHRHVAAVDECGTLRRKAHETGKRKWKAEYAACRRHA